MGNGDGRPQARTATADHDDIMLVLGNRHAQMILQFVYTPVEHSRTQTSEKPAQPDEPVTNAERPVKKAIDCSRDPSRRVVSLNRRCGASGMDDRGIEAIFRQALREALETWMYVLRIS